MLAPPSRETQPAIQRVAHNPVEFQCRHAEKDIPGVCQNTITVPRDQLGPSNFIRFLKENGWNRIGRRIVCRKHNSSNKVQSAGSA